MVRRGIQRWAAGQRVQDVQVFDQRSLRRFAEGPSAFVRQLRGRILGEPQRRGKYLWIPLAGAQESAQDDASGGADDDGLALMIHLGMSGQVLIADHDAPAQKHLKVTLELGGRPGDDAPAAQLRFVDQRIFGGMQLSPLVPDAMASVIGGAPGAGVSATGRLIPAAALHIAADPLEPTVNPEWLFQALRGRRTGLKRALLDQTLISGVGNIYADEALWRAQLHYARRTETVTRREATRLLTGLREVMDAALEAGGTSFDALYVNVNGASGYFDRSLASYGQEGRPCKRCRTPIARERFMNRSSYLCPVCQRKR